MPVGAPLKQPTKIYKVSRKIRSCRDLALLPDDGVVLADSSARAIKIFSDEGEFEKVLVKGVKARGITATRSGLIAFTVKEDRRHSSVRLVMPDGQGIGSWGLDLAWKPHALCVTNRGRLVVTDTLKPQVALYTQDGRMLYRCHTKQCDPPLKTPQYVSVDVHDRVSVCDVTNHCVHVFDGEGKYLFKMGGHGWEEGRLRTPQGIATDSQGNFLICDAQNKRVSVLSQRGRFIEHLLTSQDGLRSPVAIDFSRTGRLVVANYSSSQGSFVKLRAYDVA